MIKWIAIIIFALIGLLDVLLILGSAELERRRNAESIRPQGWIPCSERLPRWDEHIDEMVLVCYGNGSVRFNTFMNGQWCQGNPLAWMPLPEPWKGADDE